MAIAPTDEDTEDNTGIRTRQKYEGMLPCLPTT